MWNNYCKQIQVRTLYLLYLASLYVLLCLCQVLTLCRPVDSRLEHVDFDSLLQCLSVGKLLQVFASILLERRVIFIADKLRYCCGNAKHYRAT